MNSNSGKRWFRGLGFVGILGLGGIACWFWLAPRPEPVIAEIPMPAKLPSPYLNSAAGTEFVGIAECQGCHAVASRTYHQTAHSQALAHMDLAAEPPDGEFEDRKSLRKYRIHREVDGVHHEESIRFSNGEALVLDDPLIKYVIGSGHFSRSYLIERDGFLFESPATWYSARSAWGLSPGYQHYNAGFQRPVELRCLFCHAGRVEPLDHSPQRVALHALAVDCERCHGPGELHTDKWPHSAKESSEKRATDLTIVNPAGLERDRAEDICAQCHFQSAATVELRGRNLLDFRPGERLADYVTHFGLQSPSERMEVTGHVEQLRLSRCYLEDATLTCTSCHAPHNQPAEAERVAYYRGRCLSCHAEQACGLPIDERKAQDSSDNCVTCHMPRGPTDIPHFAFTHHRIGIHDTETSGAEKHQPLGKLIPLDEVDGLAPADRNRNLGLGYLQLLDSPGQNQYAVQHRVTAQELLQEAQEALPGDPEIAAGLARLAWPEDPQEVIKQAQLVMTLPEASPDARATACFTLGATYYQSGRMDEALPWLQQTVKLRPTADVWAMLSECHLSQNNSLEALEAARRAAEMAPDRPRYVQLYAELLGKHGQATELRRRIPLLQGYRQRVDRGPLPGQ